MIDLLNLFWRKILVEKGVILLNIFWNNEEITGGVLRLGQGVIFALLT